MTQPSSKERMTSAVARMAQARRAGLHTLALTVGYRGAAFSGFARQPGQLTVQGELEHALSVVFARQVETVCAGRTDAGVHARGQVVTFDVSDDDMGGAVGSASRRTNDSLRRSLNALTHDDIVVYQVSNVPPGFSARFDARAREYRYFIACGSAQPLFMRDFCWYVPGGLDVDAMQRASRCLIGEHDFKSFCKATSAVDRPTCRNISDISFAWEEHMGERVLCVKVVGNAFLHSMVRTIVGTLVAVGRGQRLEEWVKQALDACDRRAAGECAPACGLVFWRVIY